MEKNKFLAFLIGKLCFHSTIKYVFFFKKICIYSGSEHSPDYKNNAPKIKNGKVLIIKTDRKVSGRSAQNEMENQYTRRSSE
jgi:hypothetical protein